MWKTRVTEILGIDYPILEGGMAIAGNGELPPPSRTPAASG